VEKIVAARNLAGEALGNVAAKRGGGGGEKNDQPQGGRQKGASYMMQKGETESAAAEKWKAFCLPKSQERWEKGGGGGGR